MKKIKMIHPESKYLIYWDTILLIAAVYITIEIPLALIFTFTEGPVLIMLNWVVTILYIMDIFINFNTALIIKGKVIEDRKFVALKYLKGWFFIDFLAAFPFGEIIQSITKLTLKYLNLPKLLRLIRLARLIKLIRLSGDFQKTGQTKINPAILRLFLLVFWIFIVAHLITCLWIYITAGNTTHDPVFLDNPVDRYIRAFYWTITTLTTIGYGDIVAKTRIQTIFVICIELAGAAMYGLIIGNIANLISNIDIAKTQFKERMKILNTFLKYRKIPVKMKERINRYYNYLWESRRGYDEAKILQDLPLPLKTSISLFLNKNIIEKVPIFEGASDELIKEIILSLDPMIFTPGDNIVIAGEVGMDMYFVSKGSVDVLSKDEKYKYATLIEGQFFGEIALLLRTPRTATIKAREFCDLYRLHKDTFDGILKRYPDFKNSIRQLAEKRKQEQDVLKISDSKDKDQTASTRGESVLARVGSLQAELKEGRVRLTWKSVKDALGYDIIRKYGGSEKWNLIQKQKQDTTYSESIKPQAVEQLYKVRAVFRAGLGPWSDTVAVKEEEE